jgi:O-acetyl-ADP-ribose deacetylase (regulator of RNase III)
MTIIKGDLLEITKGIICHQVNCQRVAGKGLALQIRNKWPEWFEYFVNDDRRLGDVSLFEVEDYKNLVVASLYAQERYGKGLQTDYKAFEKCLSRLREKKLDVYESYPIYFPAGIGAGLAGGNSEIIHPLIEKYFPNAILVEKP